MKENLICALSRASQRRISSALLTSAAKKTCQSNKQGAKPLKMKRRHHQKEETLHFSYSMLNNINRGKKEGGKSSFFWFNSTCRAVYLRYNESGGGRVFSIRPHSNALCLYFFVASLRSDQKIIMLDLILGLDIHMHTNRTSAVTIYT